MMAITTSSSISVNAPRSAGFESAWSVPRPKKVMKSLDRCGKSVAP